MSMTETEIVSLDDLAEDGSYHPMGIPGQLTPTSLILPDNLSFEEWDRVGVILLVLREGIEWWIGDWLRFGQHKYGDMYTQAQAITGRSYSTLTKYKFVAEKIESFRRRKNLPWSHHAEVASLESEEQDYWLDVAQPDSEDQPARISVMDLRRSIKKGIPPTVDEFQILDGPNYRLIHDSIENLDVDIDLGSVDVIITDPPYPKEYLHLYEVLAYRAKDLLKPGGSVLAMCGQSYLPDIMGMMAKHLTYHWTVSYLTPGGQAVQLWDRRVNTFWKPVLWFVNGDYDGDWVGDVTRSAVNDNDKDHHHWGQSESGMVDLIERFSKPGNLVLDPFLGGGTTGVVALRLGRRFIGVDIDEKAIQTAAARLKDVT